MKHLCASRIVPVVLFSRGHKSKSETGIPFRRALLAAFFLGCMACPRVFAATYTWNGTNTLSVNLGTNESVTVTEAAGSTSFSLSAGTWAQSGGSTAPSGNGTSTITFADAFVATSLSISGSNSAGNNNISFTGGTVTSASITLQTGFGSSIGAISESGTGALSSAGLLDATANGGIILNGPNTVTQFNALDAFSAIRLTNTAATLTVSGLQEFNAQPVSVTNTGNLTLSGATTATASAVSLTAANGALTINAGIDASAIGSVTLASTGSANDLTINGTINSKNAVSATSDGNVKVQSNVTGSSASFTAAKNGASGKSVSFPLAATVAANSQTYTAGNGSGTSTVSFANGTFRGSAGGATSPANFVYKQDAGINDNEPSAAQYGNGAPANLTIQSTNGNTTLATGANVNGSNLTLAATGTLFVSTSLSLASLNATSLTIQLFTASIATSTNMGQTYNGNVTLYTTPFLNLDASGAASGAVTINGGVDANTGAATLTVTSGSAANSSISGKIQNGLGLVGLTVTGGTLTLSGANTYTFTTLVNASSILRLGAANATSAGSDFTLKGILDLNGHNSSVAALSNIGTVTNGNATAAVLTVNGTSTFGGIIQDGAGTAGLTAAGNLTLTGSNTYSGNTTVNAGVTLAFSGTGNLHSIAAFSNAAVVGTLDLAARSVNVGTLTGTGTVKSTGGAGTILTHGTGTFGGAIQDGSGPAGLTVAGGTLTLSGASTYSGATVVTASNFLKLGAANATSPNSVLTLAGTLDLNGHNSTVAGLSNIGTVTNGNATAAVLTVNAISSFDGVIQDGTGTTGLTAAANLTLSGSNTYSGDTTVNGGATLSFTGTGNLHSTAAFSNAIITGTLDLGAQSVNVGSLTGTGAVTSTIGAGTILTNGTGTFDGSIQDGTGTTALSVANGALTLTAPSTYSGQTSVASGATLLLATTATLPAAGDLVLSGGSTFGSANGSTTSIAKKVTPLGDIMLTSTGAGSLTLSGQFDIAALTPQITLVDNSNVNLAGSVTGTGGLNLLASNGAFQALLEMSGASSNTYTGLTHVSANLNLYIHKSSGAVAVQGDLQIDASGLATVDDIGSATPQIASTSNVTVDGDLRFDGKTANFSQTLASLAGSGFVTNHDTGVGPFAMDLHVGAGNFSGTLREDVNAGALRLVKESAGLLTLSGANTHDGGTTVLGGLINFNNLNNFGTANITLDNGGLQWAGGTTTDISGILNPLGNNGGTLNTSGNNVTLSSAISGAGTLSKTGAGTLTMAAVNTYSGATTVFSGGLAVTGSVVGDVSVAASAKLSGTGMIGGNITLQSNGSVAPGTVGIGTLSAGGAVTWNGLGGSSAFFDLSGADNTSDRLAITGALTKGSGTRFEFDFANSGRGGGNYLLATFASTTFAASDFSAVNVPATLVPTFTVSGTELRLGLNAPPVVTTPLSASPGAPIVGDTVTFAFAASDPESQPVTYSFDYGDGTSGSSFTHVYNSNGSFTVVATASDGALTVQQSINVTVLVNLPPTINTPLAFAPANPRILDTVTFSIGASDPEGRPLTISFNYGDGSSGTAATHAYQAAGTYTATATVFDGVNTVVRTIPVPVVNVPPAITTPLAFTPPNPRILDTVTFSIAASDPEGQPVTISFDFGDGSSGAAATHVYQTAGTYTATATVSDGVNNVVRTIQVPVINLPPAITTPFTFAPAVPNVGDTVTFSIAASDPEGKPVTITFDYGDGTSGTSKTHVYTTAKTYTVTANVSDGVNTVPQTVTVPVNQSPAIQSGPLATPNPAILKQPVAFTVAATDLENNPLTYSWNFGDGATGSGASVQHSYAAIGTYLATVSIFDGTATTTGQVSVVVGAAVSLVGAGTDSDGDGFSDSFEVGSGSAPGDAASTPGNVGILTPDKIVLMKLYHPSVTLNFRTNLKDTIKFTALVDYPERFPRPALLLRNAKVLVDISGVTKAINLDSQGFAITPQVRFGHGPINPNNNVVQMRVTLSRSDFKQGFAALGLKGDKNVKNAPIALTFSLIFEQIVLQATPTLKYTATAGRSGMAR